ncbi:MULTISPECIES: hypothetical protein [Nostoc]|uniref:Uncharacterized protein n=1 Tax=Nostoc paludosum FACHB-159 TaxID=2692908 RepID=A0ABR8KDJ7_9NOSO|nr:MULTISPECIES: hypothetical protein [Nostoc]MBD2681139.1 hypothetical protein [Nostoc sp. FACHB-857]MBD2737616.1 hypothetical protein [Nostoc paludosum FACHB-159]
MVHSFTFPQEIITSIQERIEFLGRCLNDANTQDKAMAEIVELANSRQISLNQLREELRQYRYKFDKLDRLLEEFIIKCKQGELALILFVKYNFLLKEIVVDKYWYFGLEKDNRETEKELILAHVNFYQEFKTQAELDSSYKDDYIVLETLKHVIQSMIKASLKVNVLSEEEINALDLGDINPQETEVMLTSLASTKKWDQVYRNLA